MRICVLCIHRSGGDYIGVPQWPQIPKLNIHLFALPEGTESQGCNVKFLCGSITILFTIRQNFCGALLNILPC